MTDRPEPSWLQWALVLCLVWLASCIGWMLERLEALRGPQVQERILRAKGER